MSNWFEINHGKNNGPLVFVWVCFILFVFIVMLKLFWLQVVLKKDLTSKAHEMRQDKAVSFVMRGRDF
jgi:cell division protein FtsI/penicillin-binding protein 2